jgi:rubrerythrin
MLKRDEIEGYFREIAKIEHDMVDFYTELEKMLEKKEWKDIAIKIRDQEIAHVKIAEEILKISDAE